MPRAGPLVAVVAALPEQRASVGARHFCVASAVRSSPKPPAGCANTRNWQTQRVHGGEAALARLPVGPRAAHRRRALVAVVAGSGETAGGAGLVAHVDPVFRVWRARRSVCGFPDWADVVVPGSPPRTPRRIDGSGNSCQRRRRAASPPRAANPRWCTPSHRPFRRGSLVFLGNSLPIREWNVFAATEDRWLRCHANRGANGIDGCVSTFLGLGADEAESWAVVGDLTALYDLAALWITPALPARAAAGSSSSTMAAAASFPAWPPCAGCRRRRGA